MAEQFRYYFDRMPFEQDALSHLLTTTAQANVRAHENHGADRQAIAHDVEAHLIGGLGQIFPKLSSSTREAIVAKMPAALRHPAFGAAYLDMRDRAASHSSIMSVPSDVRAAIVMTGLGLPAAILSAAAPVQIVPPTLDVDLLVQTTRNEPSFVVGFAPAATDFFYVVAASVRSLRRCLKDDPRFASVRDVIAASQLPQPSGPNAFWAVYAKPPRARIPSVMHFDNPGGDPTVLWMGGWMEGGLAHDPGIGPVQPISTRVVEHLMRNGSLAMLMMGALK